MLVIEGTRGPLGTHIVPASPAEVRLAEKLLRLNQKQCIEIDVMTEAVLVSGMHDEGFDGRNVD
jgi:hypothetical protein